MTERRLEKTVEYDASPEEVWAAIATGPGISSWFVPHTVEPREGGAVSQHFGTGFDATGTVTAWEEGRRFAYTATEPAPEDRPPSAFEFLVEARAGGGAVLRFVQSGFLDGPDWDAEYNSLDKGWTLFFENLRAYLTHFAGQPGYPVVTMGYTERPAAQVWPVMLTALGLAAKPAVGAEVVLDGPQKIAGVVDHSGPEFLGVRSAHGLHRFGVEGDTGCGVSAYHYFYGEPVDTAALATAWDAWLAEHVPPPATPAAPGA